MAFRTQNWAPQNAVFVYGFVDGSTELVLWIPACAGMTVVYAGMTVVGATKPIPLRVLRVPRGLRVKPRITVTG